MTVNTDYNMTPQQASEISGWAQLVPGDRKALITSYGERYGQAALIDLFAQFIGLACSVNMNCHEMSDLVLITEFGAHPERVPSINLPTILGACQGVMLAARCSDPGAACAGCAYRMGTAANQSPVATKEASWQLHDPRGFMCHAETDDRGEPVNVCVGHAITAKRYRDADDAELRQAC